MPWWLAVWVPVASLVSYHIAAFRIKLVAIAFGAIGCVFIGGCFGAWCVPGNGLYELSYKDGSSSCPECQCSYQHPL